MIDYWSSEGAHNKLRPARVVTVTEACSRKFLHDLLAEPIDALLLIDHAPFVASSSLPELFAGLEIVRGKAQRAIFALELARRAAQTLLLRSNAVETWSASLATFLDYQGASSLPRDWPAPPSIREDDREDDLVNSPLMATYLAPLFAAPGESRPLTLAWPRECFLSGDAPGTVLPETTEVAGSARILAYGPYLPLPSGRWRAKAFLGFSVDIGKMPFILEADAGTTMSRGFFEVDHGGIFTLELDFEVVDAMHPVELRLISQDSALEGRVALIEVALEELRSL